MLFFVANLKFNYLLEKIMHNESLYYKFYFIIFYLKKEHIYVNLYIRL